MAETHVPFGSWIRSLRERRGLNQTQLAEAAGLTPSYVCLLESGRRRPPSDAAVRRIAASLGESAEEALRRAQIERAPRELRATVEDLSRRAALERALREQAAAAVFPFSLWRLLPGGLRGSARGQAQSLGADVVEFLDGLLAFGRSAPDAESFRRHATSSIEGLPEDRRRRVLDAAPLLLAAAGSPEPPAPGDGPAAGTSGEAPRAAPAPAADDTLVVAPPGLPPDVLPGDRVQWRSGLTPEPGDVVVVAVHARVATVARHPAGAPPALGVVTEIRRSLRGAGR